MKKIRMSLIWASALLLVVSSANAQETGGSRVPTVTRLVKIFSNLELALSEAQMKADLMVLGDLLAERFEMRIDARPGEPIARAEWLATVAAQRAGGQPEQMAVHDFGEFAVVSFLLKGASANGVFIVDVWRKVGDSWKLDTRYAASRAKEIIPGAPSVSSPPFQKRY